MHELLLRNARIIDPASGRDEVNDIAFADGRGADIGPGLEAGEGRDLSGHIVSPGLIDLHTHIYWGGTSLGVDPVAYAREAGATTLVDAGSAGAGNFHGFRAHVIEPSAPRLFA